MMDNICRTCLCEGADVYIFKEMIASSSAEENPRSVYTMVANCTQLELSEGDGLPPQICRRCFEIVMSAFAFKIQAKKAEERLRSHLGKTNRIEHLSKSKNNYTDICNDVQIKTEVKNDDNEKNMDNYNISVNNDDFDDSEDDLTPLIDLKNTKKSLEMKIQTTTPQKPVPCDICKKSFKSFTSMVNHKRGYHLGYPHCDICSRTFSSQEFITRHKIAAHSCIDYKMTEKNENNYQCNICLRMFTKQHHLTRHKVAAHSCENSGVDENMKTENNRSITCVLCGLKFIQEDHLISHINLSHSGPKKRGRPSKKELLENKLKLKKILEVMNVKTEDDYEATENSSELFDDMPGSPFTVEKKPEIDSASNEIINYFCSLCSKAFYSDHSLMKHNEKHLAYKPSLCKLCNKMIKYNNNVKDHLQNHIMNSFENIDMKLLSSLLGDHEKFSNAQTEFTISNDNMKSIIKNDIENEKYDLYIGEMKVLPEDQNISDSENSVMKVDKQNNKVKIKKTKFKNESNISRIQKYACSICNYSFKRYHHVMRHMAIHKFNFPDKCDVCNKIFPNEFLLKNHKLRYCANAAYKSFQCGLCYLKFVTETSMNKHMIQHQHDISIDVDAIKMKDKKVEAKPFNCSSCDKSFSRSYHLDRHVLIHLPKDKKYECPTCLKRFHRKDNLRMHTLIHTSKKECLKKTFLCMYCGKSFMTSSHLVIHIRRHKKENPFKCDICGKGFPRTSDLKYHRRTHTGEKPYQCTVCGKGFSRSDKLNRHTRIHLGIKPYKCTYCDKAFTQSNDLAVHIRRHTGCKPYVCGVCGERFIQGTALHNHRRITGHYEDIEKKT